MDLDAQVKKGEIFDTIFLRPQTANERKAPTRIDVLSDLVEFPRENGKRKVMASNMTTI